MDTEVISADAGVTLGRVTRQGHTLYVVDSVLQIGVDLSTPG
jgi:hypothetical protein